MQIVNPSLPIGTALEIRLRYHHLTAPVAALFRTPDKRAKKTFVVLKGEPISTLSDRDSIVHSPRFRG
jgi:hypothetical protein